MPELTDEPARSGYMPELDGLRGCAILLVFLVHARVLVPATNLPAKRVQLYLGLGWVGVDLFFVLSGFLITGILLETRQATNYFRGFYARRTLRIFPLYYTVLTAVILVGIRLNSTEVSKVLPLPEDRWVYYTYLTNWIGLWKAHWGPDYGNFLAHFWSLAVEEQFYLVWPLLVWLMPTRRVPTVAASLALVAVVVRWMWVLHSGEQVAIALATACRMDSLFIGAIAACIFRERSRMARVRTHLPAVAALSLGSFLFIFSMIVFLPRQATTLLYGAPLPHSIEESTMRFSELGGFSALAVGFCALVLMAADPETPKTLLTHILRTRWLRRIGKYSYGIYLFHVPLLGATTIFVVPRIEQEWVWSAGMGIFVVFGLAAVTFVISAASYELFERPILKLKCHFEPKYVDPVSAREKAIASVS